MITKICLHCSKEFKVKPYRKDIAKFCSRECDSFRKRNTAWNRGLHNYLSPESIAKSKISHTGQIAWNKGLTKETDERVKKMSEKKSGKPILCLRQEKHWNWKGGITPENRVIRHSAEYRNWRMKVFKRDRFTCVECGYRSVKRRDIRADHIRPFSMFPELRFNVENGRTLCLPCDLRIGWRFFRKSISQI